jgi:predicted nucleic acid-binding protein
VKRYVAEAGSEAVRDAMAAADGWFMCRIGYVETIRALTLAAGDAAARHFRTEWPAFGVVEVDQPLAERAGELAGAGALRSLDALHLAAAMLLPRAELILATWDRRLHAAALHAGVRVLPERFEP